MRLNAVVIVLFIVIAVNVKDGRTSASEFEPEIDLITPRVNGYVMSS
ncbi:hypothetical protein NPIL_241941, partial [Nephila pilipes]